MFPPKNAVGKPSFDFERTGRRHFSDTIFALFSALIQLN
jgi:hypothetical protein